MGIGTAEQGNVVTSRLRMAELDPDSVDRFRSELYDLLSAATDYYVFVANGKSRGESDVAIAHARAQFRVHKIRYNYLKQTLKSVGLGYIIDDIEAQFIQS